MQYDAPIHRTADGRWDLGVPPEQVLTLDGAGPPSLQGARGPQDARVLQVHMLQATCFGSEDATSVLFRGFGLLRPNAQ